MQCTAVIDHAECLERAGEEARQVDEKASRRRKSERDRRRRRPAPLVACARSYEPAPSPLRFAPTSRAQPTRPGLAQLPPARVVSSPFSPRRPSRVARPPRPCPAQEHPGEPHSTRPSPTHPTRNPPQPPAMVAPAASSSSALAQLLPHLDRQLVLPILDFLESREKHSHEEVLQAKIDLLGEGKTNMVTFVEALQRELEGKQDSEEVAGHAGASSPFALCKQERPSEACCSPSHTALVLTPPRLARPQTSGNASRRSSRRSTSCRRRRRASWRPSRTRRSSRRCGRTSSTT